MCIRDSCCPCKWSPRLGREVLKDGRSRRSVFLATDGGDARSLPERPKPVSYTHLTLPTICSV
eukprot:7217114-Alexandrium_andersonii.AAC.1